MNAAHRSLMSQERLIRVRSVERSVVSMAASLGERVGGVQKEIDEPVWKKVNYGVNGSAFASSGSNRRRTLARHFSA
jgi:hypothetical protein